ncbi:hypothetical protein GCM10011494_12140 [Novosphingobium endophyticum]|uniref:O-antigen ligase-related domain-containing protein n=1 Tax=Novosphingobium endophyticum TaxID=1955250 RepID=A0A916TS69_9SPHN|nr:O-antigen ligase family protein [Novosphingobium endophyticum]GGB95258.1 hypothetical protein GCM10011494_12140 [Novosphingobium endophyticum]
MNAAAASGPYFGLAILGPATLVLLVSALIAGHRIKSLQGRFVFAAIWLRMILGAYHVYMFKPLAAGMSGNALASVAVAGVGLLVIRPRHLMLKALLPVYFLMALVLLSGVLNRDMGGIMTVAVKYGYFVVLLIAAFEALRRDEAERLMPLLIWAFAPLLLFQALSIVLNLPKGSEGGDGLVWIGGYNHESSFSISLLLGFIVGSLAHRLHPAIRLPYLGAMAIGIFLAGYRTSLIAAVPLLLIAFWVAITHISPSQRRIMAAVALMAAVVGVGTIAVIDHQRFVDMGTFLANPAELIKPPREFTQIERGILSARPLIWSEYIYAYSAGLPHQLLFGFGPESWEKAFNVYPHNTLIGTLYELGGVGVGVIVLLWISMAALVLQARRLDRPVLAAAHLSFFFLNMGTMPFWQIEGLALYAVLCGYTLFSAREGAQRRANARAPSWGPMSASPRAA